MREITIANTDINDVKPAEVLFDFGFDFELAVSVVIILIFDYLIFIFLDKLSIFFKNSKILLEHLIFS